MSEFFMENRVHVEGRLAGAPIVRDTKTGGKFVTFSIANYENGTKANGEPYKVTEYIDVTGFGFVVPTVENLKQGDGVYVVGKLRSSKYVNKDGFHVKKVYVLADMVYMVAAKKRSEVTFGNGGQDVAASEPFRQFGAPVNERPPKPYEEDIPF